MRTLTCILLLVAPLVGQQVRRLAEITPEPASILADVDSKTYYLYTTKPLSEGAREPAVVWAYRSKDLENWDGPRVVFTLPSGMWANPGDGLSTPRVQLYRGRYYLIATLYNRSVVIERSPPDWRTVTRNAPHIFMSDSPEGPFVALSEKAPTPEGLLAVDASLYVDGDIPYFVYAHDWNQVIDGGIEAIRMKTDLSAPAGDPFQLFRGSEAPWLAEQQRASKEPRFYVTATPLAYRTKNDRLLMLWSSRRGKSQIQAVAYSLTDRVQGPWRQAAPLLTEGAADGMVFRTFEDKLMLMAHGAATDDQPRAFIFELQDTGDAIRVAERLN